MLAKHRRGQFSVCARHNDDEVLSCAIHGDQGSAVIEQDDLLRWDFKAPKPDDDDIRQRFAQKVGASGGSLSLRPAADGHGTVAALAVPAGRP